MDPVSALHADQGICCLVGAGGKKTTMYALAERLDRAVVTATVRIPIFDEHVRDVRVTTEPASALADVDAWPVGLAPEREGDDRYRGYDPATVDAMASPDGPVFLVKADGARMRRFKAPDEDEPRIPRTASTVIAVVSAHVLGAPLDEGLVHRPERVAALADIAIGDRITPAVVAEVLTSPAGGRKAVPADATFVPLVNMVDDEDDRAAGRAIAEAIHARADVDRVVLAAMRELDPIVELVAGPSPF